MHCFFQPKGLICWEKDFLKLNSLLNETSIIKLNKHNKGLVLAIQFLSHVLYHKVVHNQYIQCIDYNLVEKHMGQEQDN